MALTQGARNKIKSFVQSTKKLLVIEFEGQLQQYFGIRPDGTCLMVEELTSKDASIVQTARLLRERLNYLEETIAGTNKKQEAVQQLVREQAFTILNRFVAIRMAEDRNIIQESIRKSYNSEGFQVFDQLTGGAKTADQFTRYTWYIKAVFDELAIDLPAVFDRFSPYALLFPSERVLIELLETINDDNLAIFREEGQQPLNLWKEDETIGWVYQYYNSREEISAMREASGAPRNSRELAVRNQFFTPRYVVQFLVDNSLGRQWYEMTQGFTDLSEQCQYMVKRPNEVFLQKGEQPEKDTGRDIHFIEYRAIKDPRYILMLDPACGSMHFGLYSFDLYEQIYTEAWDNHPELMPDLRDKYLREDFIKQIPQMIIRYNIHGVDIDPRAIQIAGLSLWLRAQRYYDEIGLKPNERPAISKSNLVVAEPMPGDAQMLSEFTKSLPGPIGKLVRVIWDKMKLAGETGMLLKIEEELKKEIEIAKQEWAEYKKSSPQTTLFSPPEESKVAEMAAIYGKGQKITKDFFNTAEEQVLQALKDFAENADGEGAFQKLLFAEDTARGFAFIELCRKRYDVIVMNPPFGSGLKKNFEWQKVMYPDSFVDLLSVFVDRGMQLSTGIVGAITSRNILLIPKLRRFRQNKLIPQINIILDLGWPVMDDATVHSAAYILDSANNSSKIIAINRKEYSNKEENLLKAINEFSDKDLFLVTKENILKLPESRILYQLPEKLYELFSSGKKFRAHLTEAKQGLKPMDDFRFVKSWTEVKNTEIGSSKKWRRFAKGGGYSIFCMDLPVIVNYYRDGIEMQEVNRIRHGQTAQARQGSSYYYRRGGTYSIRTTKDFGISILPKGFIIGGKGVIVAPIKNANPYFVIGLMNSTFINFLMKLQANASQYDTGIIESLPFMIFSENDIAIISKASEKTTSSIASYFSYFETSEYFTGFIKINSFDDLFKSLVTKKSQVQKVIEESINVIDKITDKTYSVNSTELIQMLSELTDQDASELRVYDILPALNQEDLAHMIISFIVGVYFNRYSIEEFENYCKREVNLLSERRFEFLSIKEVIPFGYIENNGNGRYLGFTSQLKSISNSISKNLNLLTELEGVLRFDSIEDYIISSNGFFNNHITKFTLQRKVSPIYWPISTESNSLVIYLYYLGLNENTLFKILNEIVEPKIEEVKKEVSVLESGGSAKEFNDKKELRDELLDFKGELLRIAQLPYKPKQDDGVLITAAPLHNLFRHTKWRKSTEDCWKKLEKGDYDWAHLAYSIWPERVREKCKTDLSMAIAHGLEDICEIKPKEKKEKKTKVIKENKQGKLL